MGGRHEGVALKHVLRCTAHDQDIAYHGELALTIFTDLGQTWLDVQWCLSKHIKQQLVSLQWLVPAELLEHMLHERRHLSPTHAQHRPQSSTWN